MIKFVSRTQEHGANIAQFNIDGQGYAYSLPQGCDCSVAERTAKHKPGEALAWVKARATEYFLVEAKWPFRWTGPLMPQADNKVTEYQLELPVA